MSITSVRTTISLEEDVLERVREESRSRGESFRETLNNLLRFAISAQKSIPEKRHFELKATNMGQVPGLNYDKVSELLDYGEGEDRKW